MKNAIPNSLAGYVYSDLMSQHILRQDHPMQPVRLHYLKELLDAYNIFDLSNSVLVQPRQATETELLEFHEHNYLEAVKSFSAGETLEGVSKYNFDNFGDNPTYRGMYEAALLSTGGSLTAVELITDGQMRLAFNPSGGLHHAFPAYTSGFCIFNDPVIAIKQLVKLGLKVLYVDVDAHHGDGVQSAFYNTDQVTTVSFHESGEFLFPGSGSTDEIGQDSGRGYSVNVPLGPYTGDDVYIWAFEECLLPIVEKVSPDILVSQVGIDTYYSDPLTHLNITTNGYAKLLNCFKSFGLPWICLGGGGYDLLGVAKCWAIAYSIMIGETLAEIIPEPFASKYSMSSLYDNRELELVTQTEERCRAFAEKSVLAIHNNVFPFFKRNR